MKKVNFLIFATAIVSLAVLFVSCDKEEMLTSNNTFKVCQDYDRNTSMLILSTASSDSLTTRSKSQAQEIFINKEAVILVCQTINTFLQDVDSSNFEQRFLQVDSVLTANEKVLCLASEKYVQ